MKAVIADVTSMAEDLLEERHRRGADRWDEVWEGVLHMPPMPNREHQEVEGQLETWVRLNWARPCGNRVHHQINVASRPDWRNDFRIPDLVLLTPDRFHIDRNEYFEGGPDVVVEIRSPNDETDEKVGFYTSIGVREIWIIDRDYRVPEIRRVVAGETQSVESTEDGWLNSEVTGIELRHQPPDRLVIRIAGDDSSCEEIPAD